MYSSIFTDTEDLYTEAFQNILSQYGKTYTFELKLKLMGSQAQETAKTIVSDLELPISPAEFMAQSKIQFDALFPDTEVMPG